MANRDDARLATTQPARSRSIRLLWFAGLWLAGVAAVGLASLVIRLALAP